MTSIGQLRRMSQEQRTKTLAEYGPVARLKLVNLLGYAIEASLAELEDLRNIMHALTVNLPKPPNLDPEPWVVIEADGRRYSDDFIRNDYAEDGAEGIVRSLAQWKPRAGHAQHREDYS